MPLRVYKEILPDPKQSEEESGHETYKEQTYLGMSLEKQWSLSQRQISSAQRTTNSFNTPPEKKAIRN